MTAWCVVCERSRINMGRNSNQTYINVLVSPRRLDGVNSVSEWLTANPGHPWNDSQFNEFIIEITEQEFNDFRDNVNPLTWGEPNQPRWQQQTAGSGSSKAFGSWSDPTDSGTTWNLGTPIPDSRLILRFYNSNPASFTPQQALDNALDGREELDDLPDAAPVTRWIKLYTQNDTASGTNAQDQKEEIGGNRMIFDFTNGVTSFQLDREKAVALVFPNNGRWRIKGPSGDLLGMTFDIFSNTLKALD